MTSLRILSLVQYDDWLSNHCEPLSFVNLFIIGISDGHAAFSVY